MRSLNSWLPGGMVISLKESRVSPTEMEEKSSTIHLARWSARMSFPSYCLITRLSRITTYTLLSWVSGRRLITTVWDAHSVVTSVG